MHFLAFNYLVGGWCTVGGYHHAPPLPVPRPHWENVGA